MASDKLAPEIHQILDALTRLSVQFSGVYAFNDGATHTGLDPTGRRSAESSAALRNPIYKLSEPVFIEASMAATRSGVPIRFSLHVDIDGQEPLNVVSGSVESTGGLEAEVPQHFIGRVATNTTVTGGRKVSVGDFRFRWPGQENVIDRLDILLAGTALSTVTAEVTFVDTSRDRKYGPFTAERTSIYFHDVEVDVDREKNAIQVEPVSTHAHADRPADLDDREMTLESVFASAGVRITRTEDQPTPVASPPGHKWDYSELHDSMVQHWEAFANRPQWKMWILLAERADDDGLGGVMFDGDIDEPGGVDRQGTALFTLCPYFHTAAGEYAQANPPVDAAIKRELFFNLIHETGHAFNLAHSFQKTAGQGWTPPPWNPLASNARALSWMNYPDQAEPGMSPNASWFYKRFKFRFDDSELLFLRHAPESYVQMGAKAWFQNHGRVMRDTIDERLEFSIRTRRPMLELGEPVMVELRLRNTRPGQVPVHENLDPSEGLVEIAITAPNGERRPYVPIDHTRSMPKVTMLDENKSKIYGNVDITMGAFGFHFKTPGAYRIEASYTNYDGRTAASVLQVYVAPPSSYAAVPIINDTFDAKIGRALYVEGTRAQGDVNDKLDWIERRLADTIGKDNPLAIHLRSVRWKPLAKDGQYIDARNKAVATKKDPDEVVDRLENVLVDRCEDAANTMGHIWYRQMVDVYTKAAEDTGQVAKAAAAQRTMAAMFKRNKVVSAVVEEIEERAGRIVGNRPRRAGKGRDAANTGAVTRRPAKRRA